MSGRGRAAYCSSLHYSSAVGHCTALHCTALVGDCQGSYVERGRCCSWWVRLVTLVTKRSPGTLEIVGHM